MEANSRGGGGPGGAVSMRAAVQDLFNLYLGGFQGCSRQLLRKNVWLLHNWDHDSMSPANTLIHERVARTPNGDGLTDNSIGATERQASSCRAILKDDQFADDFAQLKSQFLDEDQLRGVTESVIASLLVSYSSHVMRAEFLVFALQTLSRMRMVHWDSFLQLFLRAVSTLESQGANTVHLPSASTISAGSVAGGGGGGGGSAAMATLIAPASSIPQVSTPASPSSNVIGSPAQSVDPSIVVQSPAKGPEASSTTRAFRSGVSHGDYATTWFRKLVCKIMKIACEAELKPLTCLDIFNQMIQWIQSWNAKDEDGNSERDPAKARMSEWDPAAWLYSCIDVINMLIDEKRRRLPFYVLIHQLPVDHWPEDEVLFALFLEIHRRRDKVSLYMKMLDQHLQCPTLATQRMLAFTYPGVMEEPLIGEDVAAAIPRGSMDWERALRSLSHGLHAVPSSEWWRRVLVVAPRYRSATQQQPPPSTRSSFLVSSVPGHAFTAEMTCDAVVERIVELMQPTSSGEVGRWQEWVTFADLFFYFMRNGFIDFLELINKLYERFRSGEQVVRTNHVTWLFAQVFRLEMVTSAISADANKVETTFKILSFHKEERPGDQVANFSPQSMLLDFVGSSQNLRLWTINRALVEQLTGSHVAEHIQKGKQIDEWWKQVVKGERVLDYSHLDDQSMGMIWTISHTMSLPVCDAIMGWMKSNGISELIIPGNMGQPNDRLAVVHETRPLPMNLLSGLSLHLSIRFIGQIEELILNGSGQMLPSIAMLETYTRLLLVAPQTLFRHHLQGMMQRYQVGLSKTGINLLYLELLNYRLIPLYRYHGKVKQLFLYDVAKIIVTMKGKRGEHRFFRLAENLGLNLILSIREVMKEVKAASMEFSETLSRTMILNLAITSKTRGIAELEQVYYLRPVIEQCLAATHHTWSEKTMRCFPQVLQDVLSSRPNKRSQIIQGWQQAEATVVPQCHQLLSSAGDHSYALSYLNHISPQHRQYLCAAVWILMDTQLESITLNLVRVLKELSPEEITTNIYIMVDVLLYNIQVQLQLGHPLQDMLLRASAGLARFIWTQELLPFDIVLLALADRDDDPHALRLVVSLLLDRIEFRQRVQSYHFGRGQPEHWLNLGPFQRPDAQQVLGNHLIGKDRFPVFFDDLCIRALPMITLVIYRLIENDLMETAEKLLSEYASLLVYHPSRFSFVRDILAYFYGLLPNKLIMRLLSGLDLTKTPFSDAFLQHVGAPTSNVFFVTDYFMNLLVNLVSHVIPPLNSNTNMNSASAENSGGSSRPSGNKNQASPSSVALKIPENNTVFYQYQDPGTFSQLLLETAVIELLSLPHPADKIVSTLFYIAVSVHPSHSQSLISLHNQTNGTSNHRQQGNPTSPSGAENVGSGIPITSSNSNTSGSGGSLLHSLVPSSLMIQAFGLLLAQLPTAFHRSLFTEAARVLKDCWWITDPERQYSELDAAYGYAAWDPTWAAQDDSSTVIGNTIALLHAFASNLPFEWLEGMHSVITQQRPITSVAQLRLAFRIICPLLPRFVISRPLFAKTLALLFTILADVFGRSSHVSGVADACEISDLVDLLHHAAMLEAQGHGTGKPRPEILVLCSKAIDRLHPDLHPLFRHLTTDPNLSIYESCNASCGYAGGSRTWNWKTQA